MYTVTSFSYCFSYFQLCKFVLELWSHFQLWHRQSPVSCFTISRVPAAQPLSIIKVIFSLADYTVVLGLTLVDLVKSCVQHHKSCLLHQESDRWDYVTSVANYRSLKTVITVVYEISCLCKTHVTMIWLEKFGTLYFGKVVWWLVAKAGFDCIARVKGGLIHDFMF